MGTSIFISIVVCTRNRMDHIGDMLQTLVEMDVPKGLNWELVVVDNGSTDKTFEIANSFSHSLPLTVVKEPQAGLSFARNKGVETARGEYFIWTDDDVRVDKAWLSAYAKAFKAHQNAAYFGGVIQPVFLGESPKWLSENNDLVDGAFAERNLGDQERLLNETRGDLPFGANFAVRGKEQRSFKYSTYLGVSPNFRRVGEETHLLHEIIKSGGVGYWVPSAKVLHIIPEGRQTLDYLMQYNRSLGETWAVLTEYKDSDFMNAVIPEGAMRIFNVPLWVWKKTVLGWYAYTLSNIFRNPKKQISAIKEYGFNRGAFDYFLSSRS